MSLSAPRKTAAKNPAKKFIKWKGSYGGYAYYYDKDIEDKTKRNVTIDLSAGFSILDKDLFSITGFDEPKGLSIVSNAVRGMQDKIVVKGYKDKKSEVLMQGTYEEIRDQVRESKIFNYTREVYINLNGELCHLSLSGSAFAAWIAQVESNSKHESSWIKITGTEHGKKGVVEWDAPVFEVGKELNDKEFEAALAIDRDILQPFLSGYLAQSPTTSPVAGDHHAEEYHEIDTSKWREQLAPSGKQLCELSRQDVTDLAEYLVDQGESNSELYQYVGQALFDYQQVSKTWDSQKDKAGKKISDYTVKELKDLIEKIRPSNPSKLLIEIAIDALSQTESFVEDDDIPF